MIPVTQTTSWMIDTVTDATDPWSTVTDTTPPIHSRYLHHSHPYLSDPQTHHIEKWPEFASCMRTLQHWQLKLPNSLMKTTKILSKYRHPLSSQQMKGLPKGWEYKEDDEEGKHEELHNPSWYGHLPPRLTHMQQHLKRWCHSTHQKGSSTTSGRILSPSPSPMNMES